MKTRLLWLSALLMSCGVQGGDEGEDRGECEYDTVSLADPDEVPEGFAASPRQLFSGTSAPFAGELREGGVALRVRFTPDFDQLTARYGVDEQRDCGPHLEVAATATLEVDDGAGFQEQASTSANLELRWQELLARASFDAGPDTALAAIVPEFSAEPLAAPTLGLWLDGLDQERVAGLLRWSAPVACERLCAGAGSGQVEEIEWQTTLTSE